MLGIVNLAILVKLKKRISSVIETSESHGPVHPERLRE